MAYKCQGILKKLVKVQAGDETAETVGKQLDWKLETEHKAEIELKNHFKIKKKEMQFNNSCIEPSL